MNNKNLFDGIIKYSAAGILFAAIVFFYGSVHTPDIMTYQTISHSAAVSDVEKISLCTSARSAVVVDCATGTVLYSDNPDERLPMASTTKIMTALVALENAECDIEVEITEKSVGIEGSSIYLEKGEIFTLEELLYGLMLESGNDAANAIAIAVAGNENAFVELMNRKALDIGLSDTKFENPHGLSSDNHYTTARELAVITCEAMKNPTFRKIVSTDKYTIKQRDDCRARFFSNHNRLLRTLDICDGIKTGYTLAAGRCLVTSASVNESRFVAVTLNDRNDWKDHASLLSYACDNYETVYAARAGELSYVSAANSCRNGGYEIKNADDICATVKKGENIKADLEIKLYRGTDDNRYCSGIAQLKLGEETFDFPLQVCE